MRRKEVRRRKKTRKWNNCPSLFKGSDSSLSSYNNCNDDNNNDNDDDDNDDDNHDRDNDNGNDDTNNNNDDNDDNHDRDNDNNDDDNGNYDNKNLQRNWNLSYHRNVQTKNLSHH